MHCHVFPPVFSKWVASQYIKCLLSKQQSTVSSVQNKISSLAKIRVPVFSFHLHSCRWHLDILMFLCGYKVWENWDHLGNYWSHGYCHCSEPWSSYSVSLESSSASMHLEHNDLAHLENKISGTLILVQIQIFCLHFFSNHVVRKTKQMTWLVFVTEKKFIQSNTELNIFFSSLTRIGTYCLFSFNIYWFS